MISAMNKHISSGYLGNGLEKAAARKTIRGMAKLIRDSGIQFSAIAYTGQSGALIAPAVAYLLNKNLILVRKEADFNSSHSSRQVEGYLRGIKQLQYIIIDDLTESGSTFDYIAMQIKKVSDEAKEEGEDTFKPMLKGIFLWNSYKSTCKVKIATVRNQVPMHSYANSNIRF